MVKINDKKMERPQERGLPPENDVVELQTEYEQESAGAELDRATIDDILIEHPTVSEKAAIRGLGRIKQQEKKQKKPKNA